MFSTHSNVSMADEIETLDLTVRKIYTFSHGTVWLSVNEIDKTQTCRFYGGDLWFDTNGDDRQMMLPTLMAAHLSKSKIGIKYEPTTAEVGSDHNSGCITGKRAILKAVYF